ncbi:glycoside hydrolase family 3 N-terminal domain-containing protein [Nesterenkonia rhizosphaerae]|uniref:beta-N-acetylhexosaminidase n=1 Tax=Nesterenkonia rhizosphaerae TaxID=1348272 RepID=A0ABP9FQA5_9MICC
MNSSPRRVVILALAVSLFASSCATDDAGPDGSGNGGAGSESSAGQQRSSAEEDAQAEHDAAVDEARQAREAALAGPGEEHYEQAAGIVAEMSLQQQAGQVLIGEYQGNDVESAAAQIQQLHLGGVILMGHNIPGGTSSVDTEALTGQLQVLAAADPQREVPPILSVDQEGGLVTRVGAPVTEWPTPMAYGAAYAADPERGLRLTRAGHQHMGRDLLDLGFTVSFAPNADVTIGAADPTIGSRSLGGDPEAVGNLAVAGIRGLAEGGLAGSVKHFPGHGSVTDDSHYTLPVQQADLEQLRSRDWVPFAQAVEAGVPMVMMGHIEVPALDPGVPSSLSAAAYEEIRSMGHEGVIVTDAMNMAATYGGGDQAAVSALAAGADLLLMPTSVPGAHAALVEAVESGELPAERLSEAAERVIALVLWQQDLAAGELAAGPDVPMPDILHEEDRGNDDGAADLEALRSSEAADVLLGEAVTVVEGQCEAPLVTDSIQIYGGTEQDRARLAAAAERAGISTGAGPVVTLLGGMTPGTGDVVVALDRPEGLASSTAGTKIALYGRTPESFDALLRVLTGEAAPGGLPVSVGEYGQGHSGC